MNANAIALSALLLGAGLFGSSSAQAVMTPDQYGSAQVAIGKPATAPIQLADGHKGGDKYLSGKAGGAKGIGGQKGKKDGK